jgi:signal transduction histidine kinase
VPRRTPAARAAVGTRRSKRPGPTSCTSLRQSRARTVTAADNERRELECELHGGVRQRLIGVRIQLAIGGESDADACAIHSDLRPESSSLPGLLNSGCQLGA